MEVSPSRSCSAMIFSIRAYTFLGRPAARASSLSFGITIRLEGDEGERWDCFAVRVCWWSSNALRSKL